MGNGQNVQAFPALRRLRRPRPAWRPGRHVVRRRERFSTLPRIRRRLDTGRMHHVPLDYSCKDVALLLASEPLSSRIAQPFSTADVMKAGETGGSFFGHKAGGLIFPSHVMRAENFPVLIHEQSVRTMCGCVSPRYEQASGRAPRGAKRAGHLSSSSHLERSS